MHKGNATHLHLLPTGSGVRVTLLSDNAAVVRRDYTARDAEAIAHTWERARQLRVPYEQRAQSVETNTGLPDVFISAGFREPGYCSFTYRQVGNNGGVFYRYALFGENYMQLVSEALLGRAAGAIPLV